MWIGIRDDLSWRPRFFFFYFSSRKRSRYNLIIDEKRSSCLLYNNNNNNNNNITILFSVERISLRNVFSCASFDSREPLLHTCAHRGIIFYILITRVFFFFFLRKLSVTKHSSCFSCLSVSKNWETGRITDKILLVYRYTYRGGSFTQHHFTLTMCFGNEIPIHFEMRIKLIATITIYILNMIFEYPYGITFIIKKVKILLGIMNYRSIPKHTFKCKKNINQLNHQIPKLCIIIIYISNNI